MSIKDLFTKIKVWGGNSAFIFQHKAKRAFHSDFFTVIIIIFVAFSSFGLGKLSSREGKKSPILIERNQLSYQSDISSLGAPTGTPTAKSKNYGEKSFVASKSGTKYYLPWCGGVSNIKEANKIWFSSETEAKKAGYSPATNCTGLKK